MSEFLFHRTIGSIERERVNPIGSKMERTSFNYLVNEDPSKVNSANHSVLRGIHDKSQLNQLFLSQKNMNIVQDMIRYGVFQRINEKISKQSEMELLIIMRAIYLQNARFMHSNITDQLKRLNKIVVDEVVPGLVSNIKQYYGYVRDASQNPRVIDRPINLSNKGTRVLDSVTTKLFF